MTRWVYPPCPRQSYVSGVGVLVVAPAPFVLFCCVSCWRNANLAGRFASRRCLAWFFVLFVFIWYCLELWNQGVSHCLPFIYPLLSLLGPSLRAKSAATEEKKLFPWCLVTLAIPISVMQCHYLLQGAICGLLHDKNKEKLCCCLPVLFLVCSVVFLVWFPSVSLHDDDLSDCVLVLH